MKINTYHDTDRANWGLAPWVATYDDYDGAPIDHETPSDHPIGFGYTEDEAIEDLKDDDKIFG